jgi:site-specific DNA-methyltransferase (adenine-specific)
MRTTGLTAKEINTATDTFMGSHYLTDKTQPAIPTPAIWATLRPLCGDVPAWVDELVERIAAEREVVGQREVPIGHSFAGPIYGGDSSSVEINITAPSTEAAKQWEGWGTALKPAMEPITVARKPLIGTVAENVLQHGTGAINVDGCRVGTREDCPQITGAKKTSNAYGKIDSAGGKVLSQGRWPANFIHDGSDEVVGLLNEAARFFYCAKASKADRDAGCEGMEIKQQAVSEVKGQRYVDDVNCADGKYQATKAPARNHHPTVKPTDLMRYLCRLVTPPNGIVLDPFNGSGSTGCAAVLEGFQYIGIEREAEYIAISEKRIQGRLKQANEQPKQLTLL